MAEGEQKPPSAREQLADNLHPEALLGGSGGEGCGPNGNVS